MIGNLRKNQEGTTLIEVLVAITVFSILVSITTNIFLLSSQASRKVIFDQNAQGSLAFVFDSLNKELKNSELDSQFLSDMSKKNQCKYEVARSCNYSNSLLIVRNKSGNRVTYFKSGNALFKQVDGSFPEQISSKSLKVDYLNFYLNLGVNYTPSITIVAEVRSEDRDSTPTTLQTTITLRDYATGP